MASVNRQANGRRTIQFVGADNKRRSIRLGKVSQRTAEGIKLRVESLNAAQISGQPLDEETARWVADLEIQLAGKLARVGLIRPIEPKSVATLGQFLEDYTNRRIDVKPATKEVWQQVVRNLTEHFGVGRDLAQIDEGNAEDFKLFLIQQGLASTTVHKRLQFARMFFRAAKKRKLVSSNPFAEVTAKAVISQERQHFVTLEDTEQLFTVCDLTWKVIVGLSRYGGLRCPSEVLSLRWPDVNWELERITVTSPKTEHHPGKGSRVVPLFAELRPILEEAFEAAPDGAEFVVGGDYRKSARRRAAGETATCGPNSASGAPCWPKSLAKAVSRHAGIEGDGVGQGVSHPRRNRVAGQHTSDRVEALLAGDGRRL